MLEFAVDGIHCKDGVFANISMSVFEAGTANWDKGFEKFCIFRNFLKKAKSCTTDIFVWVLLGEEGCKWADMK